MLGDDVIDLRDALKLGYKFLGHGGGDNDSLAF
jgi:hypothetical protein